MENLGAMAYSRYTGFHEIMDRDVLELHCTYSKYSIFIAVLIIDLTLLNIYCRNEFHFLLIFIPCHTIVAGYYGVTLDVRVSVRSSVLRLSVHFSFPVDNLSKHQRIFTKLGMCIDIVDIWFGIANGQISSNFYRVTCPRYAHIFVSGQ